jgi:hypothetical protein
LEHLQLRLARGQLAQAGIVLTTVAEAIGVLPVQLLDGHFRR